MISVQQFAQIVQSPGQHVDDLVRKALDRLEFPLKTHYLSPGRYKIDPAFAPLRGDPRFERLIAFACAFVR